MPDNFNAWMQVIHWTPQGDASDFELVAVGSQNRPLGTLPGRRLLVDRTRLF